MKIIRCVVACNNSNGEPDFYFAKVQATAKQIQAGGHYETIKLAAETEGYERPMVPFDEYDNAGRALMDLFTWDSASIFPCLS